MSAALPSSSQRGALAIAVTVLGCQGAGRGGAAGLDISRETVLGLVDPSTFRDPACSTEPNTAGTSAYDEPATRRALADAASLASSCQGGGPWTSEIVWGPSGCVRSVDLVQARSSPGTGKCLVGIYSQISVPQFYGSTVRAFITAGGSTVEFSKVGTMAPPEIQDVVVAEFGRFRSCYEKGLARNRSLQGRVSARFIIDESGAVQHVANAGSDLPDDDVVDCVLRVFPTLRFPQPVGGTVSVVYPIVLAPG